MCQETRNSGPRKGRSSGPRRPWLMAHRSGQVRRSGPQGDAATIEDQGPAFPDYILQGQEKEINLKGLLEVQRHSGLGLPICRRIVSVMGGELKFYNDPPKTRIRIWLPLH